MAEKHDPTKPRCDDKQHEPDNRNVISKLSHEDQEHDEEGDGEHEHMTDEEDGECSDDDAEHPDDRNVISKLNHEDEHGKR